MSKITNLANSLKYKIQYGSIVEWYNLWYILLNRKHPFIPKVASIEDTITYIVKNKASVSRFGDGEVLLTLPSKKLRFQDGSQTLADKLTQVLTSNEENHIVCLSDMFQGLNRYTYRARRFWRTHFFLYDKLWFNCIKSDKQYYNTFITRPYMDFASKEFCGSWFKMIKQVWDGRDVIIIEGEKSRLGIGNDLFDNMKSIQRILCPPQNAFASYDRILAEAMKHEKDALYLIALGPTATVLAYDLYKSGRQAVDVGHVDIEYEWWRLGCTRKVALPNKYVNESPIGTQVSDAGQEYESQIIARI